MLLEINPSSPPLQDEQSPTLPYGTHWLDGFWLQGSGLLASETERMLNQVCLGTGRQGKVFWFPFVGSKQLFLSQSIF